MCKVQITQRIINLLQLVTFSDVYIILIAYFKRYKINLSEKLAFLNTDVDTKSSNFTKYKNNLIKLLQLNYDN